MSLSDFFKSPFSRRSDVSSLPSPPLAPEEDVPAPPSEVDFAAILLAAGVSPEQRSKTLKAQELLRTLPGDTPAPVKRDIVEAAFKAFDVPTQEIVAAASKQIEALKAFTRTGEEHTQAVLAEGNQQIQLLESKIAGVKASMDREVAAQAVRARSTLDQINKVQPVLQFFARDGAVPSHPVAHPAITSPGPGEWSQGESVDVQFDGSR
ncbi:hypothetical protein WME75_27485 [Sorangium sp. So ce1014]|uniref:hypothetical protein n=1 Tax=Sorangium sp. So ce1014 TaxID=3133326 RepID=UPI003F62D079